MNAVMRDPRTLNHMDPETTAIHLLLEVWGKWAKHSGIAGYPKSSPTEKAARYGKLGIPQESNYKGEPEMPEEIARLDAAVGRLCEIDRAAIRAYYTHWEPREVMARKCGMRARQFLNVLRRARWRLTIYLNVTRDGV
jgi:hypothetical protein